MKSTLRRLNWVLTQQVGIDIRRLVRFPVGMYRYIADLYSFSRHSEASLRLQPCLHDWWEQAGAIGSEYFWQDLFVAQLVFRAAPRRHIDIGSRVDGFVAHLASFRELEVIDVRQINVCIPGVKFRQADIMKAGNDFGETADSISCLHAIEHFGLGRYGDPIQVDGVERGLATIARMLERGGQLYLSAPFGADAVYFNAHRCIQPSTMVSHAAASDLVLQAGWLFDHKTKQFLPFSSAELPAPVSFDSSRFTLAVYLFIRN